MPKINWMYMCDYAYKDMAGKTSIIGMFSDINTLKLPVKYQQIFTILEVEKVASEVFDLEVTISSPSEKEITKRLGKQIGAQAQSDKVIKLTMIFAFYGVNLSEAGEYHLLLFLNGNCIHSIPFRVHLIKLKKKEPEQA